MKKLYQSIIDKYYPEGSQLRGLVEAHSRQVADLSLERASRKNFGCNPEFVENAAMLHDVGVFLTHAPGIYCNGTEPYLMHGILGARLLRDISPDLEPYARVCERHIGVGLTAEEIIGQHLPIVPVADYLPETIEEQLVCYADNFFSKSHIAPARSVEQVRSQMKQYGEGSVARLEAMISLFE